MSVKNFGKFLVTESAVIALQERSEKSGVSVDVLAEVFDRGIVAWDESTLKTPEQYAFNRVDSFLAGGFAAKLDEELLDEVSRETLFNYIRKSKHVVDNTPEDSKSNQKSKKGIERAEKKLSEETLDEISQTMRNTYVDKATKSVEDIQKKPYSNKSEVKNFKRSMYISFAKHVKEEMLEEKVTHPEHKKAYVEPYQHNGESAYKASSKHGNVKYFNKHGRVSAFKHAGLETGPKSVKENSNVVDTSGSELIERNMIDPAQYVTVQRRQTKSANVIQRHNQRERELHDTGRTREVLNRGFQSAKGKNNDHLTDKSGHQLTDRWALERKRRILQLKQAKKNVTESEAYIEARQRLHDAHSESARVHAGMERDKELRRQDLHRAKRHAHASRVLEILKTKKKK